MIASAHASGVMRVRVSACPPLLDDLLKRALAGDGIELTESTDCLITVLTPDRLGEAVSRIVLVLGSSVEGDVEVIVDGVHSAPRPVRSDQLRDLVITLGRRAACAPPVGVNRIR